MNPSPIFNACVSPQHMNVVAAMIKTVFQIKYFNEDFDNGSNRSLIRIGLHLLHLLWNLLNLDM